MIRLARVIKQVPEAEPEPRTVPRRISRFELEGINEEAEEHAEKLAGSVDIVSVTSRCRGRADDCTV